MHNNFFDLRDLIQNRYEIVRLVKHEKISIDKSISIFGFKSRSSYYLFAQQIREEGFVGLLDLRPFNRKISINKEAKESKIIDNYNYSFSKRPSAAIWNISNKPWNNAFYGLQHKNYHIFIQIVRAFAEGNGIRGISRIFGVDKNTVLKYLERAAYQCRGVTNLFVIDLHVEEAQLDEMWSFVFKKEKNLTEDEYILCLKGDQWCWGILDARTKVLVQYEIGKRTYRLADDLIRNFKQRTDGKPPLLVTSDGYKGYTLALLKHYGISILGKRNTPPPEMNYAIVQKIREKGRVTDIKIKVIFGNLERIKNILADSPVSNSVNIAFVERSHLSRRQFNRRLARKTLGFSKKLQNHLWHYELETAIYNFIRPHHGLKYKTPMMAAGKTDHIWSIEELLSYTGK